MAHSHNCLLRGLNAILQQGPHIPSSAQANHNTQDVKDLLFYVEAWTKTVEHHHRTEETTMFPAIEKLAGIPGLMSGPMHQHEAFHSGLVELQEYAVRMQGKVQEYKWRELKGIIDAFAPALHEHLTAEIGVILDLEKSCDSQGLKAVWDEGERVAKANGNLGMLVSIPFPPSLILTTDYFRKYEVFPLVLGTCDKTYEGGNEFPPLPAPIPYAIKYWFGRSHSGAWRFNPCDFWGKPQPLLMLPENRGK
jgi:hemerythrin-like domain-containing protein